jgi:hypothetical protein
LLDFTEVGDNVVNLIEVFVPFLDLVFEGGEVAGTKHGSDFGLVFFKHLKVLLTESGGEIFGIFMFLEIEFDILPGLSEFLECLFHLSFLTSLIGDFLDILSELGQVHFVDVSEVETFINSEFRFDKLADHVPMSFSHGLTSEFTNKGQEYKPLFDFLHETIVGISTFIDFHVFKGRQELLDGFFHREGVNVGPGGGHVVLELLLADSNVIPKLFHGIDFVLDAFNLLLGNFDGFGRSEFSGVTSEVSDSSNESA